MDYIKLKSKLHRLINIADTYTAYVERHKFEEPYNLIDTKEEPIDLTMIIDLFIRLETFIKDFSSMIWYYSVPFDLYVEKYLKYRDDICNISPSKYIEENNKIKPRSFSKLLKKTNYIVGEFAILSEFIKDDIDRLDDLSFKIGILILNILIFIGQFVWRNLENVLNFF